jgi:hypothetical protein
MTRPDPAQPATTPPAPDDIDELALLAAGFPAFQFWRETTQDRTRYIARAHRLGTRPHTAVTTDPGELAAALTAGQQAGTGA